MLTWATVLPNMAKSEAGSFNDSFRQVLAFHGPHDYLYPENNIVFQSSHKNCHLGQFRSFKPC